MACTWLETLHIALCSPSSFAGPWSSASWPVFSRRTAAVACSRLVMLVAMHLALYSLFPSSGPRCATSWLVWMRRTVRRCILNKPLVSGSHFYVFGFRLRSTWSGFLGDDFRNYLRILHSLVRQRIHVGFSLRGLDKFSHFLRSGGLREMTSCLSPYSALGLVRHRIHALRQSMELFPF